MHLLKTLSVSTLAFLHIFQSPFAYSTVITINEKGEIDIKEAKNYLQKNQSQEQDVKVKFNPILKELNTSDITFAFNSITDASEGTTDNENNLPIAKARIIDSKVLIKKDGIDNIASHKPINNIKDVIVEIYDDKALYASLINVEAAKYKKIDTALIEAVIETESNYNKQAVSSKGAMGLMQLMPKTAEKYHVKNPFDPEQNIAAGAAELDRLMEIYDNLPLVLAAYNAGEGAVKKYDGIPPYDETRNYVVKVLSKAFQKQSIALELYKVKPEELPEEKEISHMKVYSFD